MQRYNKFWVALIMAILGILNAYGYIPQDIFTEEQVDLAVATVTAALVYLVPNRS